jgi:hypothetical protein
MKTIKDLPEPTCQREKLQEKGASAQPDGLKIRSRSMRYFPLVIGANRHADSYPVMNWAGYPKAR